MKTGILGWGAYVPRYRIKVEEIARVWGKNGSDISASIGVEEKTVAGSDEDTITMSVEAARNALLRSGVDPIKISALFAGSESHPYVANASSSIIAEALCVNSNNDQNYPSKLIFMADMTFACKAGTAAIQTVNALIKSGEIDFGVAIGADTAQGKPGDALEYTAGSGAAAFVLGKDPVASIEATYSFATDTSDFWRIGRKKYPSHGSRFTGEPGYFNHVINATKGLLEKTGKKPNDFDKVVFHTPNGKFPSRAGKILGFSKEQMKDGLVVSKIGNTYAGASLIGLCNVLDSAKPGESILVTSYGSGSGSDSFDILVNDKITELQNLAKKTQDYINNKKYIDYGVYAKLRGKLLRE